MLPNKRVGATDDRSGRHEGGGIEMKASILSFRAAVLMVIAGMIWGIVMGISQDHSTMPAHAHLNLLGWVSLFLFGIYNPLHPAVAFTLSVWARVWLGC